MSSFRNFARSIALSGLLITAATPALAGEKDRARQAIAEADGKITASLQAGSAGEAPALSTEAQASLRQARELLGRGHEKAAIDAANKASELADRAIAEGRRAQNNASAEHQAQTQAAVGAAQQEAAAANARADAAAQAAQQAAADAAAARSAPPVVLAAPAPQQQPTETTVTTQTETSGAATTSGSGTVHKRVVRKRTTAHARPRAAVKTTTTVQTSH